MKLNDLRPARGATKNERRVGRGRGSGWGKTAARGSNGAKARAGARNKAYFEGGQTPLSRRIPKKGFKNINRVEFQTINVGFLEKLDIAETEIDPAWLHERGLLRSKTKPVKILGNGELTKGLTIKANAFSKSAREKIENAKGKVEVIGRA
ncbi:MAG: 50S ribosomal protein L15 [Chitinivibrionales bacterium]|nr:50S ribosomal protein L15 [Chitinivibrionales bacterium]MBD3358123.1 50S ribosomal protein L15 [Chitinivibrionales bacterium]